MPLPLIAAGAAWWATLSVPAQAALALSGGAAAGGAAGVVHEGIKARNELQERNSEITEIREELDGVNNDLEEERGVTARLRRERARIRRERDEAQEQIGQMRSVLENAAARITQAEDDRDTAIAQRRCLEREKDVAAGNLVIANNNCLALQDALTAARNDRDTVRSECEVKRLLLASLNGAMLKELLALRIAMLAGREFTDEVLGKSDEDLRDLIVGREDQIRREVIELCNRWNRGIYIRPEEHIESRFPGLVGTVPQQIWEIAEACRKFEQKGEAFSIGNNSNRKILMHGTPGLGKTELARAFYRHVKGIQREQNAEWYTIEDSIALMNDGIFIAESYNFRDEPAANVFLAHGDEYIATHNERRLAIFFLDELDELLSDQKGRTTKAALALSNYMDGIVSKPNSVILATTNKPEKLSQRLIDRFGVRIEMALPDLNNRTQAFSYYLRSQENDDIGVGADIDATGLAEHASDFNYREIQAAIAKARTRAGTNMLEQQHLLAAIDKVRSERIVSTEAR